MSLAACTPSSFNAFSMILFLSSACRSSALIEQPILPQLPCRRRDRSQTATALKEIVGNQRRYRRRQPVRRSGRPNAVWDGLGWGSKVYRNETRQSHPRLTRRSRFGEWLRRVSSQAPVGPTLHGGEHARRAIMLMQRPAGVRWRCEND